MDWVLIGFEVLLLLSAIAGTWSFFQLSFRLRRQSIIISIMVFVGDWILEAYGGAIGDWTYPTSIFFLPGQVPIEIPAIYAFFVPLWIYIIQRTYASDIDSVLQFGTPELLIVLGVVLSIADQDVLWIITLAGVAGIVVATRKKLVVLIGIIAFVADLIIEGWFLVDTGLIDWSSIGGYQLFVPIEIMFTSWALTGYLTSPRTRLVT
jgi:hypothetical protein